MIENNTPLTATTPPTKEAPVATNVENNSENVTSETEAPGISKRDARLLEYKKRPLVDKTIEIPPTKAEPLPMHPNIHGDDARLLVTIRLETRNAVVHERNAANDGYTFPIPGGNISDRAIARVSEIMADVTAKIRADYEAYLNARKPKVDAPDTSRPALLNMFEAEDGGRPPLPVVTNIMDSNDQT